MVQRFASLSTSHQDFNHALDILFAGVIIDNKIISDPTHVWDTLQLFVHHTVVVFGEFRSIGTRRNLYFPNAVMNVIIVNEVLRRVSTGAYILRIGLGDDDKNSTPLSGLHYKGDKYLVLAISVREGGDHSQYQTQSSIASASFRGVPCVHRVHFVGLWCRPIRDYPSYEYGNLRLIW